jgi:hypothetical protein
MIVKLEDLMENDGMYYVGDIVDIDGTGWVEEPEALKVLELVNQGETE